MHTITDVLGNTRPVTRVYGDGSIDCPFCTYPIHYPGQSCVNPWCVANPLMSQDEARAIYAKEEACKEEDARRKREHERAMQRIKEERQARYDMRQSVIEEAKRRGCCVHCAIDQYGRVKFINHRGVCPKIK